MLIFKKLAIALIVTGLGGSLTQCVPVVAGAAIGAAGTVAVYDKDIVRDTLSDTTISNQILEALQEHPDIRNRCHIEFTSYHGVVLLVGQAPTAALRDEAESLTHGIPGIKRLYNEITIEAPISMIAKSNDTWITTKVKSKLLATKDLKSGVIRVFTENGTVYLIGTVSKSQANLAVSATQTIEGVVKVVKVFDYRE